MVYLYGHKHVRIDSDRIRIPIHLPQPLVQSKHHDQDSRAIFLTYTAIYIAHYTLSDLSILLGHRSSQRAQGIPLANP